MQHREAVQAPLPFCLLSCHDSGSRSHHSKGLSVHPCLAQQLPPTAAPPSPGSTPHRLLLPTLSSPSLPLGRGKARGFCESRSGEGQQQHCTWHRCRSAAPQSLRAANKQISEGIFTLSPSATWQITSPVAGLTVGKVFLLTASCHSLFIKICKEGNKTGSRLGARPRGIARSFICLLASQQAA